MIAGRRVTGRGALLAGSVVLNIFVAGVLLSHFAGFERGRSQEPRFERLVGDIARTLPAEDSAKLLQVFQVKQPELQTLQQQIQDGQDSFRDLMRRDPVDQTALHAAVLQVVIRQSAFMTVLLDTMAQAAVAMSLPGRQSMAEWHRHR